MNAAIGPLISVVIPAYQAEATIERAVRSVAGQTYPTWELVVVDDGSTDSTRSVLRSLENEVVMRVIAQQNSGTACARNNGAEAAEGEFVVFLDADDELVPDCLECAMTLAAREPRYDAYAFSAEVVYPGGGTARMWRDAYHSVEREVSLSDMIQESRLTSCAVFRRAELCAVGLYDRSLRYAEDYELWLRFLLEGHRVLFMPYAGFRYHMRSSSKSVNRSLRLRSVLDILESKSSMMAAEDLRRVRMRQASVRQRLEVLDVALACSEGRVAGARKAYLRCALVIGPTKFLVGLALIAVSPRAFGRVFSGNGRTRRLAVRL